jgi:hypothetical protein
MATGDPFVDIYSTDENLRRFATAMTGISAAVAKVWRREGLWCGVVSDK